jgi:hypothetical protein
LRLKSAEPIPGLPGKRGLLGKRGLPGQQGRLSGKPGRRAGVAAGPLSYSRERRCSLELRSLELLPGPLKLSRSLVLAAAGEVPRTLVATSPRELPCPLGLRLLLGLRWPLELTRCLELTRSLELG